MLKKNLLFILLFLVAVFLVMNLGLRWYTHHGEKLMLSDFTGKKVAMATQQAKSQSFRIVVADSVFLVDREGGIIIDQNPVKGAKVKQNRKIYVTVTKFTPDKIKVSQIPELYGKDYERKKKELENSFEINSTILGFEFDRGAPGQILKVIHNDEEIITSEFRKDDVEINKGGTLQFILSKNIGGAIVMPDLICRTYTEASFYVENLNLVIGEVTKDGLLEDQEGAFIYDQFPQPGNNILTGDTIQLFLSSTKPFNCDD